MTIKIDNLEQLEVLSEEELQSVVGGFCTSEKNVTLLSLSMAPEVFVFGSRTPLMSEAQE